ncbi:MAG: hypothetical protein HC876_06330 [Chloroflexaceae bacterium]|nr:hypothetical protein [Chloroflexaceae bacterium]
MRGEGTNSFYSYQPINTPQPEKLVLTDNTFVAPDNFGSGVTWSSLNPASDPVDFGVTATGNQWVRESASVAFNPGVATPVTGDYTNLFADAARNVYRTTGSTPITTGYYDYQGEVFVSPTYCATCANDGLTWNVNAFASIQAAINSGAQQIRLRAGIYREAFYLTNGVEIIGAGADSTIIEPPAGRTRAALVSAEGISTARLARLTLKGDGVVNGVQVLDGAQNVVLARSIVRGTATGAQVDGANTELELVNNTFASNDTGYLATGCADVDVRNSAFAYHSTVALDFDTSATCNPVTVSLQRNYNAFWQNNHNYRIDNAFNENPATGDVATDPLFTDPTGFNYRPLDGSPLLGAGTPTDPTPPGTGGRVDIGYIQQGRAAFYVDDNYCESCTNDGLEWQVDAFASIQDAIDAAVIDIEDVACGNIAEPEESCIRFSIGVAAGTYNENITLRNRIRLVGEGADLVTIDGTGTGSVLTLDGLNDVDIVGLTITGSGTASGNAGIAISNRSRDISIKHTIIRDNFNGIAITGGSSAEVLFNTIVSNGTSGDTSAGIAVSGTDSWAIVQNNILDSNDIGLQAASNGQIFNTFNLLNNTPNYSGVTVAPTDLVGRAPLFADVAADNYRLTNLSPAVDAAEWYAPVPTGGGSRADMGYRELVAVPLALIFGQESESCKVGNSGMATVEVALVKVADATTTITDTQPTLAQWQAATLSTAGDTASYWNAAPTPADGDGLYRIYSRATDQVGNNASTAVEWYAGAFVADSTAPTVAWVSPASNISSSAAALEVVATASDYLDVGGTDIFNVGEIAFEVNGQRYPATWDDPTWSASSSDPRQFRAYVPLPAGTATITAIAIDGAGNETISAPRTITVNTPANVATITSIESGTATNQTSLTLSGYARFTSTSGTPSVQVRVNSGATIEATLENPGAQLTAWSATVTLASGSNTIEARAGRGGTFGAFSSISVQRDTTNPNVTVTTPAINDVLAQQITLQGTVSDAATIESVAVSFDDSCTWIPATFSGGTWSLAWQPPEDTLHESYTVQVRGIDAAGNEQIISRDVTVDTRAPEGIDPVTFSVEPGSYLDRFETLTMNWNAPYDPYGTPTVQVTIDQNPDTDPTTNATGTSFNAPLNAEGEWYAHIK